MSTPPALSLLAALLLLTPAPAQDEGGGSLPSDELFRNPRRAAHRFDDFVYTLADRKREAGEKVERLRKLLKERKLDGIVIATERNFNWLTAGGKDSVVWVQRESPVKLLVTVDRLVLIADNIEGPRVHTEELDGLGYEWVRYEWHLKESDALDPLIRGRKIAFDAPAAALAAGRDPEKTAIDLAEVYYPITPGELKKYRWLGRRTVEVLEAVALVIRPGMTEHDLQYLLCREFWYWDIVPTVVLSAVDERFKAYRHPVVHGAELRRYAALNVCTRRWGLVISTTRLVHFGSPDPSLARAYEEGPRVMAAMWAASRPGRTLGDVIQAAQRAYAAIGVPEEWRLHHQGGQILTLERLDLVKPGDRRKITPGMVLAWNPTVQGAKFEDTVVVKEDGTLENLTPCLRWPSVQVTVEDRVYRVPTLLVRDAPAPPGG